MTTRSLGFGNIIFGILLILSVVFEAAVVLGLPVLVDLIGLAEAQEQRRIDARHQSMMDNFEERLQAADSHEERSRIEAERTIALLQEPLKPSTDFAGSLRFVDVSSLRNLVLAKLMVVTGLGGLLLVSGVGLVRFRRWGRATARIAIALLIPSVIGFSAAAVAMSPRIAERWTANMGSMLFGEEVLETPSDVIPLALEDYERDLGRMIVTASALAEGQKLLYLIAALIVVSRPGVRAMVERSSSSTGGPPADGESTS